MSELDPGVSTADIYDIWYDDPEQCPVHLLPGDPPTTGLEWYDRQGFPPPEKTLDAGCGSGRNLSEIVRVFPNTKVNAFDGSRAGVDRAQTAFPGVIIVQSDLHKPWPFADRRYDLVATITTSPEATTSRQLRTAGRNALAALAPDGYWLDEGIDPDDEVAKQFPVISDTDTEEEMGHVVLWQYGNQTKPERVISLHDAIKLHRSLGAMVVAARVITFRDIVFGSEQGRTRRFTQCILQKPSKRETTPITSFAPVEGHITPGLTNSVRLVTDNTGKMYVQKTIHHGPQGTEWLMQHLSTEELVQVGFLQPSSAASDAVIYDRTGPEQQALCERLDRLGVPVAVPIYADTEVLITPHIAGQTLWEHLQDGKTSAITPALQSLHQAHKYATYGGEPWAGNFMVTKDETSVVRVDFEIAIEGKTAAELEMAQLTYAILGLTTNFDAALEKVALFVEEHTERYDWRQVYAYIEAYEHYFSEHPNGKRLERAKHRLNERLGHIAQILCRT